MTHRTIPARSRRSALIVVLALATALLPAPSAGATSFAETGRRPVFTGVDQISHQVVWADGKVARAETLRARLGGDRNLQLRPVLAQDRVPGLERPLDMGRRVLSDGGVAGVNAGILPNPPSTPLGYPDATFVLDGRLIAQPQSQGAGPRGTLGIRADGTMLIDRVDSAGLRIQPILTPGAPISAMNRNIRTAYTEDPEDPDAEGEIVPGARDIVAYSREFGQPVTVPSRDAVAITVSEVEVPWVGEGVGRVVSRHAPGSQVPIPDDGIVVVGWGTGEGYIGAIDIGEQVGISHQIATRRTDVHAWVDMEHVVAIGPQIVANGAPVPMGEWEDEGFNPESHSLPRHPRTAMGYTADGEVLLVTVDGRQPEHSVGASMGELAHLLIQAGAVDALALDGGGSTHMVVDGRTANRPNETTRYVSSGLFLFHDPLDTTRRISGTERVATAALAARAAFPDGARRAVLATAGDFPDALAGGPLAYAAGGPLLLTASEALSTPTAELIDEFEVSEVLVLGGTNAISDDVIDEVRDLGNGVEITRIAGPDRAATAARIAGRIGEPGGRIAVASAEGFADALSVAGPAALLGMPILLANRDILPDPTAATLENLAPSEVIVLGGGAALSSDVEAAIRAAVPGASVSRLAGQDRFATSAAVNRWASGRLPDLDRSGVVVASGGDFPDALAGGVYAARTNRLLTLVVGEDIDRAPASREWLTEAAPGLDEAVLLGGHGALTSYAQSQIDGLIRQ